jgi:hypothetical protein
MDIEYLVNVLIHPDFPDVTTPGLLNKAQICISAVRKASERFKADKYFQRYWGNLSVLSWFCVASDLCLDLWHPLDDMTIEEAIKKPLPFIIPEIKFYREGQIFIDDYLTSRNIARYGLKYRRLEDILRAFRDNPFTSLSGMGKIFHAANMPGFQKRFFMKKLLDEGISPVGTLVPEWVGCNSDL